MCLTVYYSLCFYNLTVFAWEAYEKGADVHLQADPTKLELLHKEYRVKKGDFDKDKKLSVLEKVPVKMSFKYIMCGSRKYPPPPTARPHPDILV